MASVTRWGWGCQPGEGWFQRNQLFPIRFFFPRRKFWLKLLAPTNQWPCRLHPCHIWSLRIVHAKALFSFAVLLECSRPSSFALAIIIQNSVEPISFPMNPLNTFKLLNHKLFLIMKWNKMREREKKEENKWNIIKTFTNWFFRRGNRNYPSLLRHQWLWARFGAVWKLCEKKINRRASKQQNNNNLIISRQTEQSKAKEEQSIGEAHDGSDSWCIVQRQ